jgi:hypothetical protein
MQTLFSLGTLAKPYPQLVNSIQQRLFPFIEENLRSLTDKEREFIKAAELRNVSMILRHIQLKIKLHLSMPRHPPSELLYHSTNV